MANEILGALIHFNLAAAAATIAVLVLRQPIRKRFGAQLAYRLWSGVPIAGLAALLPPAEATRIVPPGEGRRGDLPATVPQPGAARPGGSRRGRGVRAAGDHAA
jgi:hypothetical protein